MRQSEHASNGLLFTGAALINRNHVRVILALKTDDLARRAAASGAMAGWTAINAQAHWVASYMALSCAYILLWNILFDSKPIIV